MHARTPTDPLTALRDPTTGIVHSDSATVARIAQEHFESLLAPTHIIKTGNYRPKDRAADFQYPWESPLNPDRFTLTSARWAEDALVDSGEPQDSPETADILELLMDRCTYEARLKHIKRGKAPGPDSIPNELLKTLPAEWHDTIHSLFVIMWITGNTPHAWKESNTILLHKKNDPYLVANYRPIGLASSMYKLWTSNVTHVTMHHALRHSIIHKSQEGGIIRRDTRRQLRNLINTFEDAYHSKQDLYCLFVDFSNAFNMVDHDKLLCIMFDLGIPPDAIEVVKGIYHEHRTTINLPGGNTNPVGVVRGTIQGDPLSPLLFVL